MNCDNCGRSSRGGIIYSKAKTNIKYSQEQLQQIALGKIPGKVLKVEKELNFEEATFEYKFNIKDKENMLQVVKLDSQNGVILGINNKSSVKENKEGHDNERGGHGKN
ncbi:PepSY domain-containing protein [Clostridium sp.]|uniref:PepSY domain-containing protein n=1 Tax=Clostridium sp. TaxID=1506 RepID=UPI003457F116